MTDVWICYIFIQNLVFLIIINFIANTRIKKLNNIENFAKKMPICICVFIKILSILYQNAKIQSQYLYFLQKKTLCHVGFG